jgi:hypothetical protein
MTSDETLQLAIRRKGPGEEVDKDNNYIMIPQKQLAELRAGDDKQNYVY